jgi:hypothetical protein
MARRRKARAFTADVAGAAASVADSLGPETLYTKHQLNMLAMREAGERGAVLVAGRLCSWGVAVGNRGAVLLVEYRRSADGQVHTCRMAL